MRNKQTLCRRFKVPFGGPIARLSREAIDAAARDEATPFRPVARVVLGTDYGARPPKHRPETPAVEVWTRWVPLGMLVSALLAAAGIGFWLLWDLVFGRIR